MGFFERVVSWMDDAIWDFGLSIGGETIPLVVMALLGVGIYLTLRLQFIQVRKLVHGFAVTSGKYDDPAEPGDVPHFQALTTALSATVGIGNIAGVAIAIYWGGPGAIFWMWVTAFLGMATKYTEVTLAQHYRFMIPSKDMSRWEGTVAGGPMYYIERGLGKKWKPLAVFFAAFLGVTAFLGGNAVQANTMADIMSTEFGVAAWVTGGLTAIVVGSVIIGGIGRIGRVTGILAPAMGVIYVLGALTIVILNIERLPATLGLIFQEAFNPTASVVGTGTGAFLATMIWGVRRGLFSNEAGQGSASIAHSAAKTDEPVSEGVVGLLEPFIDTIVICTMTALVILLTGVWTDEVPTEFDLTSSGDVSYVRETPGGDFEVLEELPAGIFVRDGHIPEDAVHLAWHDVKVGPLFVDAAHTQPFDGQIVPGEQRAVDASGTVYTALYGQAVENGAPLTQLGFQKGLAPLGNWGGYIVILCVLLFGLSTAIAWSYYGDRCAYYLFGEVAVLPYKIVFVLMHFVGAMLALTTVWTLGDVFLGVVILPNLLAMVLLSGKVREMTHGYFKWKPWLRQPSMMSHEASEADEDEGPSPS